MRVAIYTRISDDSSGERLGVARQEEDCRGLAERRQWAVAGVYCDNDISAYSGKQRPEYRRMLADIECGQVEGVVAWDLDRLHRRPVELERFIDLCDHHKVALATVSGDVDLASAQGRLIVRIMGSVARHESEHKGARLRRQREQAARAGLAHYGGKRPYGFERDGMTVRPAEAAIIREAATRLLAGESLRGLAADFNRREIPTVTGQPWGYSPLRNMLLRPRLVGQRAYRGEVVGPAQWPAILSEEEAARVRHLLAENARRKVRASQRYLLSGLLICGICGARLAGTRQQISRYSCARSHLGIGSETLDAFIGEAVLAALESPALGSARRTADTGDSDAAVAVLEQGRAELMELASLKAAGRFTLAEWLTLRDAVEARMADAEKALGRTRELSALEGASPTELRATWSSLPLDRKRAIVAALLERVVIEPAGRGRRFSPERVRPVWRQ